MLEEVIESLTGFVLNTIGSLGEVGVFFLMLLQSANIPVPSEVIMPFSGFLASKGEFGFWIIVTVGTLGNLAGSLISYHLATPMKKRLEHKKEFQSAERWFQRFGIRSVFIGRMVPVVSTFISFPAGLFKVNLLKFSALTFMGAFIWNSVLAYGGFFLGENWNILGPYFRKFDYLLVGIVIIGIGTYTWYHLKGRKAKIAN